MLSASLKASSTPVFLLAICRRRSLGMAIIASTRSLSIWSPCSAVFQRCLPSKVKGRVTTPTTSDRFLRAISAITGEAPVPVPPPMPAVMNTMSAPARVSSSMSRLISAARSPTMGLPPAPNRFIALPPMGILWVASDISRAWISVFTATKSTPRIPASIIRLRALLPPPPTPTILISVKPFASESTSSETILPTIGLLRVCSNNRSGSKPPRILATTQHLPGEGKIGLGGLLCPTIVENGRAGGGCFQNLAVGSDLGLEHLCPPPLTEIAAHELFLLQPAVQLAQHDPKHLQLGVQIEDLLDALLHHLQPLQGEEPSLG